MLIAHIGHWPTQPLLTHFKQKHLPVSQLHNPFLTGYAVECILILYTFGRLPARDWQYWQVRLLNQQIIPHSTPNCSYSAIHSVHSILNICIYSFLLRVQNLQHLFYEMDISELGLNCDESLKSFPH